MTQKENILEYLKAYQFITPLVALERFGCFRLASVIYKLKQDGFEIISQNVNSNGKWHAKYFLIPKE